MDFRQQIMTKEHQSILHALPDAVFLVDLDCRIQFANRAAQRLTGFALDDLIGLLCEGIFCSQLLRKEHCLIRNALHKGEELKNHRCYIRTKSGEELPVSINASPIFDEAGHVTGGLVSVRDLCETEKINAELVREKLHRDAILSSLNEALYTIDQDWHITSFNRAAEEITKYRAEEVLGRHCYEVLRANVCANACPVKETFERGVNVKDRDIIILDRFGVQKEVKVNTGILALSGQPPMGAVVSMRDLSYFNHLRQSLESRAQFMGIVGKNKKMLEIYQLIEEIADSPSTVLIQGESGTGKELVANAIQQLSSRKDKPFIKVNCSVFPETLLASELFGHVKGAFTDAHRDRKGRFEMANGGTIFLDEIGEASPAVQIKLLRVLQEKEFERVGGTETIKVDVRVIAATNQDLQKAVREKRFREDLYYRLNVIPIYLPPLRERKDDIPLLIDYFMEKFRLITKKEINDISDEALDMLMSYDYPGNIRELENAIEYAFARTKDNQITVEKLPLTIRQHASHRIGNHSAANYSAADPEYVRIRQALEKHRWNREEAAAALGISRTTLWRKMKRYNLL